MAGFAMLHMLGLCPSTASHFCVNLNPNLCSTPYFDAETVLCSTWGFLSHEIDRMACQGQTVNAQGRLQFQP